MLELRCMHAMFFGTKRAFHATLRILRKPLKDYGLTSARFDLLWIVHRGTQRPVARQSELWKALGVTRATVSRMLGSLEAIGYVRTERDPYDRRQRLVRLTKEGLARMGAAVECFMKGRVGRRVLERAFGRHRLRRHSRREAVFKRLCDYEYLLGCVRETCGDSATLHYPWHPDD